MIKSKRIERSPAWYSETSAEKTTRWHKSVAGTDLSKQTIYLWKTVRVVTWINKTAGNRRLKMGYSSIRFFSWSTITRISCSKYAIQTKTHRPPRQFRTTPRAWKAIHQLKSMANRVSPPRGSFNSWIKLISVKTVRNLEILWNLHLIYSSRISRSNLFLWTPFFWEISD